MELKVYVAGKISKESVLGTHDWRDLFCAELGKLSGLAIKNLDPTKSSHELKLDPSNPDLIFGRNAYMISQADIVIVNLTDDISVGGSQEMLIAKYFEKPLIGIAPKEGKFVRSKKELMGTVYLNWVDPIVSYTCDTVVEDLPTAAKFIRDNLLSGVFQAKTIHIIDRAIKNYLQKYYPNDTYLHE